MTATPHKHWMERFAVKHIERAQWPERKHMDAAGTVGMKLWAENPGYSAFCGEQFIGAAGIVIGYPGVGEGWAVVPQTTGADRQHAAYFHRHVARLIPLLAETHKIRRLQVLVRDEFSISKRWIRKLGFEYESTLVKAGVLGEDLCMYVRFFTV